MLDDSQTENQTEEALNANPEVNQNPEEVEEIGETAVESIVAETPVSTPAAESSSEETGQVPAEQVEGAESSSESLTNYDVYKKVQTEISELAGAPILFTREADTFDGINLSTVAQDHEGRPLDARNHAWF